MSVLTARIPWAPPGFVPRRPAQRFIVGESPLSWNKYPVTGYGDMLPSDYVLRELTPRGGGRRKIRRVYATQWANAGTAWAIIDGVRHALPDTLSTGDLLAWVDGRLEYAVTTKLVTGKD